MPWVEYAVGLKDRSERSVVYMGEINDQRTILDGDTYHVLYSWGDILYSDSYSALGKNAKVLPPITSQNHFEFLHEQGEQPDGRTGTFIIWKDRREIQDLAPYPRISGAVPQEATLL